MKYIFCITAILTGFCGCSDAIVSEGSSAEAGIAPAANPFQTVLVTGNAVNLRQGPGTQYAIVGSAVAGDSLLVIGEAPDWYKIYVPEKSLFAWIYSGLTSGAEMPK